MYNAVQLGVKFLKYYLTASDGHGHGTHSPFVFDFITRVLNDSKKYTDYDKVSGLRKQLLEDFTELDIKDFGAGSGKNNHLKRSVASIARNAAKPEKYGRLLYRMVKHYKPQYIIELGTSLGLSAAYLGLPATGRVITMEGADAIAEKATANFNQLGLTNIQVVQGNFDDTLQQVLNAGKKTDFVFIDGNHRIEPTLRYFNQVIPFLTDNAILVFDDIHWSAEMEQAWNAIKKHPSVTCTINLFFIGIVTLTPSIRQQQHFSIRF